MKKLSKRPLAVHDILRWATACREATGCWPTKDSGPVAGAFRESWATVDNALRDGLRGLPGGSSLAKLLAEQRGVRNVRALPMLTRDQILAWADDHHARTGEWPTTKSGPVVGTDEQWANIDQALRKGLRGLLAGSSLARLLAEQRGLRNRRALPPLTEELILHWADSHRQRTGAWPHLKSGSVLDVPGENWLSVDNSLRLGLRALPGGSSLAWLLAEQRGVGDYYGKPPLTQDKVLAWADAFHRYRGRWPTLGDGAVPEAPEETWKGLDSALRKGLRSLPGGSSLARLLAAERGVRNPQSVPRLTRRQILGWADAHHEATGQWPTEDSGPIPEASGETWNAVNLRQAKPGKGGCDVRKHHGNLSLEPCG